MGIRALDSTAMSVLHAVILVALAIGAASQSPPLCQPGRDVQVVLADRQARELHTWTPNNCTKQTFESYPVRKRDRRYAASLHQCNGLTFVKNEGNTELRVYNQQRKRWRLVKMPKKLRKVINYAVTCWDSNLLIVGGRILQGPNGMNAIPQDSIWSLDCASLSLEGRFNWQKLNISLEIAAYGSCAVVTTIGNPLNSKGDLLTVVSGMIVPGDMVKRVFFYNMLTGQRWEGSREINDRIIDCSSIRSKAAAVGMKSGSRLQAYAITPETRVVNLLNPELPIYHTKLQPARWMFNTQGPVKSRFNIVGGTVAPAHCADCGIAPNNTIYYFGGWNQGQAFPGYLGDVIGTIQ